MDIDFTKNIIIIIGSCLAMLFTMLQIYKLYSDSKKNSKEALFNDYENTLHILENVSEDDEIYIRIKRLCDEKKYKYLIGESSVSLDCARHLLLREETSKDINSYKIAHRYVTYSKEKNDFEYKFGLKNKIVRRSRMYSALVFYFIAGVLALYFPMLFGSIAEFKQHVYLPIVSQQSVFVFWFVTIFWVVFWGMIAILSANFAANINFAEKLVDKRPDFSFKKLFKKVPLEIEPHES
ncbi:hypothetical protein E0H89_04020 [Acinetobacter sp. ANC 3781]|uniref:hypothetical protein n=1 Tax=Acinetobacter sp. ANC 3781 TaxID=2529835 RepID=UPI001039869E|nr:hypothetical protein [Acinetobacter sp. ANC 3781]TCB78901.1 hypothetical protein E0H89_04020 [Acinetobacter sp. ANC 3781]